MEHLTLGEWVGLAGVLSLIFNWIQYRKEKALQKEIVTRTVAGMNAGYQPLWRIAEICDWVRNERAQLQLSDLYERIQEITGNVDAGRSTMNAVCFKLTGERLQYESPGSAQTKSK